MEVDIPLRRRLQRSARSKPRDSCFPANLARGGRSVLLRDDANSSAPCRWAPATS